MEVSRKRIMYTIATNVGINHAQPDVALIVKDNVKKEDIKFVNIFLLLQFLGPNSYLR